MPQPRRRIHAYIDAANLHKGVSALGWKLDNRRFRRWLEQKYGVTEAYIFIGLIAKHAALYTALQNAGYKLVYKTVTYGPGGAPKGNCDADLVLQATRDHFESGTEEVVLVSSDGDYAPLVSFFMEKRIPCTIVSPAPERTCSLLLKRTGAPILYMNDVRRKIDLK